MKQIIVKINKTKRWFFEKIDKIDKSLAIFIKKKRERNQINQIRNEKGEVAADNTEIQRIIRDYYQQLCVNKMDNVEEMDKFLEKYNFPKLNQEEIENLNGHDFSGTLLNPHQAVISQFSCSVLSDSS